MKTPLNLYHCRFFLMALTLAIILPLSVIGCTGPSSLEQPPHKLPARGPSPGKHQAKDIRGIAPSSSADEQAPIKKGEKGTLYASIPPKEGEIRGPASEKEVEPTLPEFKLEKNAKVEQYVEYFQKRRSGSFQRWLDRYAYYGPTMRNILKERGLPEDLVFVAIVESGLSPYAYSRAKAAGQWQFISSTAQRYGLVVNSWIDERRDPIKSTHAAARYLKDLYIMLGSWPMALAGYNAGELRVKKAMEELKTKDYWYLSSFGYLNNETSEFVPQIMAAGIIAKDPAKYGFNDLKYHPPPLYDQVEIDGLIDLRSIANSVGTSYANMVSLNPELKRGVTPPNYLGYKVKIPYGTLDKFMANSNSGTSSQRSAWQWHRVRRGETLTKIGSLYSTSVEDIVAMNKLDSPHKVKAGDNILVPSNDEKAEEETLVSATGGVSETLDNAETTLYTIKPGETLYDISKELKAPLDNILRLNNLRDPNRIYAGKKLRVPVLKTVSPTFTLAASSENDKETNGKGGIKFIEHKVKKGETLSDIALNYRINMKKIARFNNISEVSALQEGQSLKIPLVMANGESPPEIGSDVTQREGLLIYKGMTYRRLLHTVQKGDTLWGIARSYDVKLKELKQWNGLMEGEDIYPGDVLQVLMAQE